MNCYKEMDKILSTPPKTKKDISSNKYAFVTSKDIWEVLKEKQGLKKTNPIYKSYYILCDPELENDTIYFANNSYIFANLIAKY